MLFLPLERKRASITVKGYSGSNVSTSKEESAPRRTREHYEERVPSHTVPTSRHRFHPPGRQGGSRGGSGLAARLSREVATMVENMRNITYCHARITKEYVEPWRILGSSVCPSREYILSRQLL